MALISLDFKPIEERQRRGEWEIIGKQLLGEMKTLERMGAECIVLTSNTMHKMSDMYEAGLSIPFIHICDPTADSILAAQFNQVGLLGTSYTMEQDFYRKRLEASGLKVEIPEKEERDEINRIIFDELCEGQIRDSSRAHFAKAIRGLEDRACQAIVLGCTEISMLVGPDDSHVPQFDTAKIHCEEAVKFSLS